MHHGIIAADIALDRLVSAINERVSRLETGEIHASLDDVDLEPNDEGWPMAMGERDGKAYILDTSLVLSTAHDLIPTVSSDLGGTTVVGAGAETTSGSYWLIAATNGQVTRSYWNCYDEMRQPWSRGEPLASEAIRPLEDLDGNGLIAALASLGFDYEGWSKAGPFQSVFYRAEQFPADGPLGAELDAFRASVKIPEAERPDPAVLMREAGGYDLVSGRSPYARAPKPRQKGVFRLFGRK